MKTIRAKTIEDVCYRLICHASVNLPPEVESAIQEAYARETKALARTYFEAMLENIEVARLRQAPLCQDTGIPMYYLNIGSGVHVEGDMRGAIESATARATADVPLRPQVSHPLNRKVAETNVGWGIPPIFLDTEYGKDTLDILAVPRGGGGEAKWQCVHPYPGVDRRAAILKIVLDAVSMAGGESCTPTIIGVGVGGYGRESTELMARKAIFRAPLNARHPDPEVAELEETLYRSVNRLGIGPLGSGGDTSCLAVHMDIAGGHTAGASVAVSFYCWSARYSKARIHDDATVEFLTHPELNGR
jgi:fumarate hydratase subunit alpha/L(+)-tartrate dehydratase alpha subunit